MMLLLLHFDNPFEPVVILFEFFHQFLVRPVYSGSQAFDIIGGKAVFRNRRFVHRQRSALHNRLAADVCHKSRYFTFDYEKLEHYQ